eukprot:scpid69276/ scgid1762/ Seprase; 170 kDa melanoma membrane-bound gelatinase; Fibroblast activation protein alpha; Integral membrane serine protease
MLCDIDLPVIIIIGVKSFAWTVFGDPNDGYVTQTAIRYPKAGSPNPSVKLHVVSVASLFTSELLAPEHLLSVEHYLMQVHWLSSSLVCALWMDRLQQNAVFAVYNITIGDVPGAPYSAAFTLNITSQTWIENYPMTSTVDGDAIVVKMPRPEGQRFVHLALIRIPASGSSLETVYLTSGDWEVTQILYVSRMHVAFESTIPGRQYRQVYRVPIEQTDVVNPECVTCSCGDPKSCGYNSFSFNPGQQYVLQHCHGPGVPQTLLSNIQTNGTAVVKAIMEDNQALLNATKEYFIPEPEFLTIEAGGVKMPAMRLKPSDGSSKYPTLFYAYNGPLSYSVAASYTLSGTRGRWHAELIGQYGFQIIIVDGRGTGYLGDVYGKAQYRRLGVVETEDQIAAARYAVEHLNADGSKLAFWGWSYGGYMASMLATSGTGVYAACIAVAPVTDWRYYDTAYTERFMRLPTPEDNLANYASTSILSRTGSFNNTKFMLIHGTADDNVHFQNTAQLVRAMVESEVDFRLQFYTDKAHSLSGSHTQKHLYRNMGQFLRSALNV